MKPIKLLFIVSLVMICFSGCVTTKVLNSEMQLRDERIVSLENELESNETRIDKNEKRIEEISVSTQEAMTRAKEAGKLAKGKFLYEVKLSQSNCTFEMNQTGLASDCKQVLDEFILNLKNENKNVYVEIQGHTDASGDENINFLIGQKRAESVYHYLGMHGIPLHRMNVISYGETQPIAENNNLEGRQQNRRVVIVVLE